MMHALLLVILT